MHILDFGSFVVPVMIFAIPIVAIVGGITAGIVRTLGQQRLIELAQRERIAAIERGMDPSKLPPMPTSLAHGDDEASAMYLSPHEYAKRRSMNLLTGGVITLSVGVGVGAFLYFIDGGHEAWPVGIVPFTIGIGLLISSRLVRPRDMDAPPAR